MSVHQKLLVSKYTAIIQLIYGQMTRAVSIYARPKENKCIEKKDIPLSKVKSDIKISYISGVALQLAKSHNSQPFVVARSIVSQLSANCGEDLLLEVFPPGLIHIGVSDSILAIWLQGFLEDGSLERVKFNASAKPVVSEFEDCVFSLQYVHARCCSLLRLVKQEKFIDFNTNSLEYIPWLKNNRTLNLDRQAERILVNNLIKILDEFEPIFPDKIKWKGSILSLVQAFEDFWSTCRIFGNLETPTPEFVIVRVGLVMATQSVLRFILEEKLGIPSYLEL